MRLLKLAAAVAIAVSAAFAIHRTAYLPWRADVERKRLEANTRALLERNPAFAAVRARQNVVAARRFLDRGIHNTGLAMVTAANYQILDDFAQASEMYRSALRTDRRPELYYNLGITEIGLGHRQAGVDLLIRAGLFNPYLILQIHDEAIRSEVQAAVHARRFLEWLDQPSRVKR